VHSFRALPLPDRDGVFVGVDHLGRPCLFVVSPRLPRQAPLRTARVCLYPGMEFVLQLADGEHRRETLSALHCEAEGECDTDSFLLMVEAFLAEHPSSVPTFGDLSSFLLSLSSLFGTGRARDLRSERQGLWGELYIMRETRGYLFWGPYWHADNTGTFDFSGPRGCLEVKATTNTDRRHIFLHRQLYAGEPAVEVVVASLILLPSQDGLSLASLIAECRDSFRGTPWYPRLDAAIRRAGMTNLEDDGPAYDLVQAATGLQWYRTETIPHFPCPEPLGVSDTHYTVDLSSSRCITPPETGGWLDGWIGG
jgi:hypothetical protein